MTAAATAASGAGGTDADAVRLVGVSKRYGRMPALDDLTMHVRRGEVFGFLGPNGAGKTTTVRILLGLTAASSGEAWVLGAPAGDRRARRRVGYAPELFRHPPWLSGREVLGVHAALAGLPTAGRADAVQRALERVGLGERGGERVSGYSKGMQQRLALAAALLGEPHLVVLDEPTSALDPLGRRDVRELIRALKGEGVTVFLNSHLLSEVELVCDRVAVIRRGRIVAEGTLDALRGRPEVRIRLEGADASVRDALGAFGPVGEEAPWLTVGLADIGRVPDLVAAVVAAGGRVQAVEARAGSLEDRLIELLQGGGGGQ